MEKEGIFYKRESLDSEDVVTLIRLWELDAGESFDDYCSFSQEADEGFLEFLKEHYYVLYEYRQSHKKEDGFTGWLEESIQYVFQHCVAYCTHWVPKGKYGLYDQQYELAYYPLAEFILKDDTAWENFVMFFTDLDNTTDSTPWIDCYDIRKAFEDRKF